VDATVAAAAGLTIRRSWRRSDAAALVELHRRVYPPEFGVDETFVGDIGVTLAELAERGWPDRDGDGAWLVDGPEGVLGSLMLSNEGRGEGRVRLFVLDRPLRGKGIGRLLLDELLELARASGYERLTLATFADLHAAAQLYREAGFVVVSEQRAPRWGRQEFNYQDYELRLQGSGGPNPAE
jgi:GNAT superfamily N-acetyltransferase